MLLASSLAYSDTIALAADPSRVIIKRILPTFMTAEAFLEAVTFALDGSEDQHEDVHGGFGSNPDAKVIALRSIDWHFEFTVIMMSQSGQAAISTPCNSMS